MGIEVSDDQFEINLVKKGTFMLVNMTKLFNDYDNQCIGAFNVYGYEDAKAVIRAAEDSRKPVILMANKDAINHMPIEIISKILCILAGESSTQVCVHLDHATCLKTIEIAIKNGFTSVMYDGSQLSFQENVTNTNRIKKIAHLKNVSVEAEIGSVGYSDLSLNVKSIYTKPEEARAFCEATNVDALAIAIGTVHRMHTQKAILQFDRIKIIKTMVKTPLVIHGASGITDSDLIKLAKHGIRKINFGTCLRQSFGDSLYEVINKNNQIYDRISIFKTTMDAIYTETKKKLSLISVK